MSSILVVDDNQDMANGIAMILDEAKHDVKVTHSGNGALSLMEESEFDLVVSDVRMPAMSGFELLERVRARWPLTKVVLLTAYGTIDSAVDAMRTGACDFLTKPFDNSELLRVVQRAIDRGTTSGGFDIAAVVGEVAATVSADDLLPSIRRALDILVQSTGADDAELFLSEPEGGNPLLCLWSGPDGEALSDRTRFEPGLGYPGIVATTGKSICARGDLAQDPRFLRTAVTALGIRSFVAAPLADANGVFGSVHLMSRQDDFPVERVLKLLERAAMPIGSAIRAGLGALRQSVDTMCGHLDDSSPPVRALLESMRQLAAAQYGTLALIDPATGRPNQVVSTGSATLVCKQIEGGHWAECSSLTEGHAFVAEPGRREWPEACRKGLPRRAVSPCCLPLMSGGQVHGLAVLDMGRERTQEVAGQLVPLLSMASQLAIRLQSHHPGLSVDKGSHAAEISSNGNAPELELRCLGPFTISRRGQVISADTFTRSKSIVLLKLLALKAGAPVNRDVLIEHLWPEVDPRQGTNRLHGIIHDLRSVIEPQRADRDWKYIRNRGELYYLDLDAPIALDLSRFRSLATHLGAEGPAEVLSSQLEELVTLYRGDLFEDDPFAAWCSAEREGLKQEYLRTLERLAELYGQQGNDELALRALRLALSASPFRDDLLLAKMKLLERLARATEAVAAYDLYRRRLAAELDAEPSAELQSLNGRLLKAARSGA